MGEKGVCVKGLKLITRIWSAQCFDFLPFRGFQYFRHIVHKYFLYPEYHKNATVIENIWKIPGAEKRKKIPERNINKKTLVITESRENSSRNKTITSCCEENFAEKKSASIVIWNLSTLIRKKIYAKCVAGLISRRRMTRGGGGEDERKGGGHEENNIRSLISMRNPWSSLPHASLPSSKYRQQRGMEHGYW